MDRARLEVAELRRNATNEYKRGEVEAKEYILHMITTCEDASAVLSWTRDEIARIEHEYGERLCPYRNSSRRGHNGGYQNNPSTINGRLLQ